MEIHSKIIGPTRIFNVKGDITGTSGRDLFNEISVLVNGGCDRIIIDVHEVPYIDSLGLGTLIDLHQMFREAEKRLVLAGPTDVIRQLFWDSSLDEIFEIIERADIPGLQQ